MSETRPPSPTDKREARKLISEGGKARQLAILEALRAGRARCDADEANLLETAFAAYPGPESVGWYLYGLVARLIDELAVATGEDRDSIATRLSH